MANIIINPWQETPGERSLRLQGHKTSKNGILESGGEFGADMLRKDRAGNAMRHIASVLHALKNAMADASWDDEKVLIVFGIQARNNWVKDCDDEWVEEGSEEWLKRLANRTKS